MTIYLTKKCCPFKALHAPPAQREKGIALMVTMVMIFTLSVLAVSGMKTATMESRLVTNALEHDLTFQTAESATDMIIDDDSNLIPIICSDTVTQKTVSDLSANDTMTVSVALTYAGVGTTVLNGYSLGSGFDAIRFKAVGTAQIKNTPTKSSVAQGIYLIRPVDRSGVC